MYNRKLYILKTSLLILTNLLCIICSSILTTILIYNNFANISNIYLYHNTIFIILSIIDVICIAIFLILSFYNAYYIYHGIKFIDEFYLFDEFN